MRGVLETGTTDDDTTPLRAAILADLPGLLVDFHAMRAAEGAALAAVIGAQLDQIDALVGTARDLARRGVTAARPLARGHRRGVLENGRRAG